MWSSTGFDQVVLAPVRVTRALLPAMRSKGWGRILNIGSYSVRQPIGRLALSNSLRLAVIGWTKRLAGEVARDGVLINRLLPGWTATDRAGEIFEERAA